MKSLKKTFPLQVVQNMAATEGDKDDIVSKSLATFDWV